MGRLGLPSTPLCPPPPCPSWGRGDGISSVLGSQEQECHEPWELSVLAPSSPACKPSHDCSHPPGDRGSLLLCSRISHIVTLGHCPRPQAGSFLGSALPAPGSAHVPCSAVFPRLWTPHSSPSPQPFLNIAAWGTDLARAQKDQADRESHETLFSRGSVASLGKCLPGKIPARASLPPPSHQEVTGAQRLRGGPHVAAHPTAGQGDHDPGEATGQGVGGPSAWSPRATSEVGGRDQAWEI